MIISTPPAGARRGKVSSRQRPTKTTQLRCDSPPDNPQVDHYNYDEVDLFCQCLLCRTYFEAIADFAFSISITTGHRWHCGCYMCTQKRESHQIYLAAGSRRDLYSELSFLTHGHPFAPQFLSWVLKRIRDQGFKDDSWWANHSPKKPLSAWMLDWQRTYLSPALIAVSGII